MPPAGPHPSRAAAQPRRWRIPRRSSSERTVATAQTELAYRVVSLTARPGDEHINPEYFKDGRLLSPSEIPDADWSIYDIQLTVYLATWGRVNDAIQQFGRAYDRIADQT